MAGSPAAAGAAVGHVAAEVRGAQAAAKLLQIRSPAGQLPLPGFEWTAERAGLSAPAREAPARGLETEERVLAALGQQGRKRLIAGQVGDAIVKTIPDFIDDANRIVGEIKDVAELGWERQLRAQYAWAQKHGYTYQLIIRRSTIRHSDIAGDIEQLQRKGIDIRFIEDILQ